MVWNSKGTEGEFLLWHNRISLCSARVQVQSLAWQSGLKDTALLRLWLRSQLQLRSDSWPGNSICFRMAKKRYKRYKRYKKMSKSLVAPWTQTPSPRQALSCLSKTAQTTYTFSPALSPFLLLLFKTKSCFPSCFFSFQIHPGNNSRSHWSHHSTDYIKTPRNKLKVLIWQGKFFKVFIFIFLGQSFFF